MTAGNASGLNDGAAAVVVMSDADAAARGLTPLARIVAYATSGVEPKWVIMTPVDATRMVLEKAGWAQRHRPVRAQRSLRRAGARGHTRARHRPAKVNVHGGAIALGHPIGASGARVLTTLLHAMRQRQVKRGVAALCLGGGNGVALAVER